MEDLISAYGGRFLVAALGVALALLLLFIVLWLMRNRAPSPFVRGGRNRQPRLQVLDAAAIDARRRIVLIRRDNVEHLVMIGGPTDIVIESGIGDDRSFVNVTPAGQQQKPEEISPEPEPSGLAQPVLPQRQPVISQAGAPVPPPTRPSPTPPPSQPAPSQPAPPQPALSQPAPSKPVSGLATVTRAPHSTPENQPLPPRPQRPTASQGDDLSAPKPAIGVDANPFNTRSEPNPAGPTAPMTAAASNLGAYAVQSTSKPERSDASQSASQSNASAATTTAEPVEPKPLDMAGFSLPSAPYATEGSEQAAPADLADERARPRDDQQNEAARPAMPATPPISGSDAQDILDAARSRVMGQPIPTTAPSSFPMSEKTASRESNAEAGPAPTEQRNLSEFERVLEQEMEAHLGATSERIPGPPSETPPSVTVIPDRPSIPMAAVLPEVRPDPLAGLPVDSPTSPEKKDEDLQSEIAKIFGDISATRN